MRRFTITLFALVNLPILFMVAFCIRVTRLWSREVSEYKVYWGTEPLLNSYYWSNASKSIFTQSIFVIRYPSKILSKEKADVVLFNEQIPTFILFKSIFLLRENLRFISLLIRVLRSASLICCSCEGFVFQHYKISGFNYRVEFYLWKLAGIKVAVFPYGADSYVYRKVANRNWLYGLISDYPEAAKNQDQIDRRLKFFIRNSDLFLPGIAMFDGMGRSDWITPSTLCIDTAEWSPQDKTQTKIFTITHAPNHRAVKGTKYIIASVESLKASGHKVKLKLIENADNYEVRRILATESDLHIDQLFADGYGLNALEAMSLGIPTVSNFQGPARDFFDQWTFTKECPIVVSSESDLVRVIESLIQDTEKLRQIGRLSREYVLCHHSFSSFAKNLQDVLVPRDQRFARFVDFNTKEIICD